MAEITNLTVTSEAELVDAVRNADRSGVPVLLLGGGSRSSLRDGFAGQVVQVATTGVEVNLDGCGADDLSFCGGVGVKVAAGESWDALVSRSVDEGWTGLAELTGVPGTVAEVVSGNPESNGATPGDTVASVRTWDRIEARQRTFAAADCRFAPGSSRFSVSPGEPSGRYVILDVTFLLPQGDLGRPLQQGWLADVLGLDPARRPALVDLRRVLSGANPVHSASDEPAG